MDNDALNAKAKAQIKELNAVLEQARDAYYKKAEPIMPDADYDKTEKVLRDLVAAAPHLAEYAPVLKTVGSDLTAQGRVKHAVPMRSIENQYTVEDLISWVEKVLAKHPATKFCLEPKFDGISVSLVYEHGYLVRALTRGTGEEGEDITAQAKMVKHIPHTLPNIPINMIVRGELVMQIEAEIADIGATGRVDDHVVAMEGRNAAEIGVDAHPPVRGPAQHAATRHGDDQHRAVGHPAEARRRIVHFEFHADVSFRRHRFDGVGEKVAEPEAAVPPARTLAEIDPFAQHARVLAHGFLPLFVAP